MGSKYYPYSVFCASQYAIDNALRSECKNTLNVQLDPQEAMKQATGMDEQDWEEYQKYLDGKLPLERDR